MNTTILLLIIATVGILFGLIIGYLIGKLTLKKEINTLEKKKDNLLFKIDNLESLKKDKEENLSLIKEDFNKRLFEKNRENSELRREKEFLSIELATKNEESKNLKLKINENKAEVEKLQNKFTKEFENLANKILEEKSIKFTKQNKENLNTILNPLHDKIQTFEKKVIDSQKENISMHSALKEQLLGLKELNSQISKEALNLTKALKGDNKIQGNWGELVLERVLEKSGLEKDREYYIQQSFKNENGKRIIPDVVIHLPNHKKMIVDSKVSLTAYEQYVNSEEGEKDRFLTEHLTSLKRHIGQLSDKKYEDIYKKESPDFVLLFIPIEPAFAIALNKDNTLYNKAFDKNIIIVTPTTLLATLRTIDTMWNNEKQQRNAIEIARQAGGLYDKFEGLLNDLISIGKKIDASKIDYDNAMNKLVNGNGNLIVRVENLKKMGAKAKKTLPQNIIDEAKE